jgi:hypothetical protein
VCTHGKSILRLYFIDRLPDPQEWKSLSVYLRSVFVLKHDYNDETAGRQYTRSLLVIAKISTNKIVNVEIRENHIEVLDVVSDVISLILLCVERSITCIRLLFSSL